MKVVVPPRPTIRRRRQLSLKDGTQTKESPIRWGRSVAIGVVGALFNVVMVGHVGMYLSGPSLGVDYLPIGVFCLFLILVAMNAVLKRVGLGLSRGEIIVAYVIMLVTAGLPQSGFAGRLVPALTYPFYYGSSTNEWASLLYPHIPSWIGPSDPWVIKTFYTGVETAGIPWKEWFTPLAIWLVPWGGSVLLMCGLGVLLRHRWLEEERLTFPLALIPLAVVGEGDKPSFNRELTKDWVFWMAAGLPFFLRLLEGLNFHYPIVPSLTLGRLGGIGEVFGIVDPRWVSLLGSNYIEIHLALVGVAILMRSEVSAGLWGFEWFMLGIGALFFYSGIGQGQASYTPEWTWGYSLFKRFARLGGSIVAVGYMLYSARLQLARAWRLAWRPGEALNDDELFLRWGFWLVGLGSVLYLGWAVLSGMEMDTALIMLGLHAVVIVVVSRIVADGGLLWCSVSLDPMINTALLTGTEHMSGRGVTMMVLSNQMPMAPRGNILPSIMDGFRMGSAVKASPGKLLASMGLGVAVASIAGLVFVLYLAYTEGALFLHTDTFQGSAGWPWGSGTNYLLHPAGPNSAAWLTTLLGGALMGIFIWLYRSFSWWPFYPFGFAIAESATIEHLWMSLLIGWAIRVIIMRMAGAQGYKRIRPAAIGVVLGECVAIGMWALINTLTGTLELGITHEVSTW